MTRGFSCNISWHLIREPQAPVVFCLIHKGKICGMAQKNIRQSYPKAGWVEHNPMEILSSQLEVAKTVLHETGITAQQI